MSGSAFIELTELTQVSVDARGGSPHHQPNRSPEYEPAGSGSSCSPGGNPDGRFHASSSVTSGGQDASPTCQQQYTDGGLPSMGQCIRSAYHEMYADHASFSPQLGAGVSEQQIPTSPERGYRGGDFPSSPSSRSDISSCMSGGEIWAGTSGGNSCSSGSGSPFSTPPLHLTSSSPANLNAPVLPGGSAPMAYPATPSLEHQQHLSLHSHPQQHHTYRATQQVPPQAQHHTMLPGFPCASPGQLVTVPTQHTCQANPFDVPGFQGFIINHQSNQNIHNTPTATSTGKPKRKRIINKVQRKAANIRERKRMFNLNEAFDQLRTKIPKFSYEKKMSRIETLRLAITYISFMTDVLQGIDPSEVKLPKVDKLDFRSLAPDINFQF